METPPPPARETHHHYTETDCPTFRPFATASLKLKVRKDKYSTSLDPRGYIPVYEYNINSQPIMWDRETGYVHFTGIWKALGNSKSDIVKMVDSNPELRVKKIRGGFLKIQGTWIPYDFAAILCRRTSWMIRKELTAIFGPRFATEALAPEHADYGSLLLDPQSARRRHKAHPRTRGYATMRRPRLPPSSSPSSHKKNHPVALPPRQQHHHHTNSNMSLSSLLNVVDPSQTTPSPTLATTAVAAAAVAEPMPVARITPPMATPAPLSPSSMCSSSSTSSSTWSSSSSSSSSPPPPSTPSADLLHQDIIDTINATLLLQRLSQDDGARPFRPMTSRHVPNKVIVGDQEYHIYWDT
ncbi:transcription regulator HTH, apses-type DNA-binding domain-containing protein [Absidia repens]|uniref:Transcription regulator HTH, apses-type DNA-binding domain-containing protein n=1 Tax=Absidia repens TaxID=90262 RepID=A0A1X2I7R8_9FUNG|nr:transcription regulator HTH, apses-type DNA-binding domain-containing protein [Absidia repens]